MDFNDEIIFVDEKLKRLKKPISVSFKIIDALFDDCLNDPTKSALDFDKLVFPLVLRRWREGDSFIPLGMKGRKKISDYMIDEKMSVLQKENTWVLCSNNVIVCIIGHRIDDRYKLGHKTEKIYLVQPL